MCMSRFPLLILLLASAAHAGWKTHVFPDDSNFDPGRASISYTAEPEYGLPTIEDAIRQLEDDGHIDRLEMIFLHGHVVDPMFQKEVIEALEEYAPEEFAEAKNSAGNVNNPKLLGLNEVLDEVVLTTPTIKALDAKLRGIGRRISDASHEKLVLIKNEDELKILFFLYLSVEAV